MELFQENYLKMKSKERKRKSKRISNLLEHHEGFVLAEPGFLESKPTLKTVQHMSGPRIGVELGRMGVLYNSPRWRSIIKKKGLVAIR